MAVSYWSMVAVALSGVFGRYLYQQIPRNMLGETLAAAAIEARNEAILVELSDRFGADQKALDALERLALGPLEGRSAPVALLALPLVNLLLARRLQKWALECGLPAEPEHDAPGPPMGPAGPSAAALPPGPGPVPLVARVS